MQDSLTPLPNLLITGRSNGIGAEIATASRATTPHILLAVKTEAPTWIDQVACMQTFLGHAPRPLPSRFLPGRASSPTRAFPLRVGCSSFGSRASDRAP